MRSAFSLGSLKNDWRRYLSSTVLLHMVVAVGGLVIARLLSTVTQFVLARRMGVASFGIYTSVYTLLGPAIMFAGLGLDTWLLRQSHDTETLKTAISEVLWLRLFVTLALMAISIPFVVFLGDTGITLTLTVLAAVSLLLEFLLQTSHTILRAQLRNYAAGFLQVLVAVLLFLLIWFIWSDQAMPERVSTYRMLSSIVGIGVMAWLLRKNLRFVWDIKRFWYLITQGRMHYAADLLANVTGKADLTMIAAMLGAVASGIYSPALTIVNTTFLIPTVLSQVFLPILARHPRGSREFRWTFAFHLATNALYGIFWAVILFFGASPLILTLFGQEYFDAILLLQIMSLIPFFKSFNFCFALYMVVRDRQGLRVAMLSVSALVNVVANLIALPLFGLIGAAWVNLFTEIVTFMCYAYGAWLTMRASK
jgi:O-antigen/teichoic acid export membrane protein